MYGSYSIVVKECVFQMSHRIMITINPFIPLYRPISDQLRPVNTHLSSNSIFYYEKNIDDDQSIFY
ncbi:hypothetical protein BCR42DRAFT_415459 [Absidia repens]|uniref:Uncharacterized protein n=1 Tax=Absidia repens TaxID=90262 RepID=A0A1X2IHL2_9FUNG|nr:hypothetical protein BCR42DRAFT_426994 [Absidia repens]ORZ16615.1 hypothetical protein BCR42DRAFT_415459 [Absidia repens]